MDQRNQRKLTQGPRSFGRWGGEKEPFLLPILFPWTSISVGDSSSIAFSSQSIFADLMKLKTF